MLVKIVKKLNRKFSTPGQIYLHLIPTLVKVDSNVDAKIYLRNANSTPIDSKDAEITNVSGNVDYIVVKLPSNFDLEDIFGDTILDNSLFNTLSATDLYIPETRFVDDTPSSSLYVPETNVLDEPHSVVVYQKTSIHGQDAVIKLTFTEVP